MMRLVAFDALFFLFPFAVYALWLMITRGSLANIADWQARTIAWLAAGGAAMMIAVLVIFVHLGPAPTGGTYVPAHVDDNGTIIPGHFE